MLSSHDFREVLHTVFYNFLRDAFIECRRTGHSKSKKNDTLLIRKIRMDSKLITSPPAYYTPRYAEASLVTFFLFYCPYSYGCERRCVRRSLGILARRLQVRSNVSTYLCRYPSPSFSRWKRHI